MPAPRSSGPLARVALLLVATLALLAALQCSPDTGVPGERAYSVQLHLHGSFSEGSSSIDSHGHEASDVGCDVLWWSDHDFRITTYEHVSRFGFEGWEEPLDRNEPWRTRIKKYLGDSKGMAVLAQPEGTDALLLDTHVAEGERSLRLAADPGDPAEGALLVAFGTDRGLERRSLATGVKLRLSLFPKDLPEDAHVFVRVQLSEHAPRAGLGLEPRALLYRIGARAGPPAREGAVYAVPVRCEVGRWNEIELEASADAVRGFPESPGEDNLLYQLDFGLVRSRSGLARVFLDDLRIEQRRSGPPVFRRQAELLGEVGALYPGLVQLQGVEVSYDSRHLNLFCEDTPLPDYEAFARACPPDPGNPDVLDQRVFRERVIAWVLAETRARGGLVSYNHPFGAAGEESTRARTREAQLAVLLENRAEGADILEVGYRDRGGASLADHLWLWDQAALAGLRLVGTGVSDSHGGPEGRWRATANNFVSWVYARAADKRSLIEGLRAGRVFFGDLERFDGTLDLVLESGERMGARVRTARSSVGLFLLATGTRAGQRIVVIESGVPTQTLPVVGERFRHELELALPTGKSAFVRFELHEPSSGAEPAGGGDPIALSNPIHFLGPDAPEESARR